jgi:peptidoglycan hydrolase-like protein with peptidoglycan-binding domain
MATAVLNLKENMMTWHLEINDAIVAAADEVGMNTGTPLTEAILPPAVDVGNDTVALVGNTFRQGDRDAGPNGDIRSAQTNMIRMGIEGVGEVDGVYGRNTMNGVQDSQEMFGLPRTGVLDQATQDAFNNLTDDQIAFFTSESEAMAPAVETPVIDETEEGLMSRPLTSEERTALSDVGGLAAKSYLEDKGFDQDFYWRSC